MYGILDVMYLGHHVAIWQFNGLDAVSGNHDLIRLRDFEEMTQKWHGLVMWWWSYDVIVSWWKL